MALDQEWLQRQAENFQLGVELRVEKNFLLKDNDKARKFKKKFPFPKSPKKQSYK